jgi:hypothetical protein
VSSAVTRKSHPLALASAVVPAGPASRESGQRCASARRKMGWTRRPRMRLVPSPLRVGRPASRGRRCSGRPAWHRTCFPSRSSDGPTPACRPRALTGPPAVSPAPRRRTGCEANSRAPPPARPEPGHAGCGSCTRTINTLAINTLAIKSPILRPKGLIALRSGRRTARRRRWLGVLPQNGARQEQRHAVIPCSARARERAEV